MVTDPALVGALVSTSSVGATPRSTSSAPEPESTPTEPPPTSATRRFSNASKRRFRGSTTRRAGPESFDPSTIGRFRSRCRPTSERTVVVVPTLRPTESGRLPAACGRSQRSAMRRTIRTRRQSRPPTSSIPRSRFSTRRRPTADATRGERDLRRSDGANRRRRRFASRPVDRRGPHSLALEDGARIDVERVGPEARTLDVEAIGDRLSGGELPPDGDMHPVVTAAYRLYAAAGRDAVPPQLEGMPTDVAAVTGATGFLGATCVSDCSRRVGRSGTQPPDLRSKRAGGRRLVRRRRVRRRDPPGARRRVDAVFHLAGVGLWSAGPETVERVNRDGRRRCCRPVAIRTSAGLSSPAPRAPAGPRNASPTRRTSPNRSVPTSPRKPRPNDWSTGTPRTTAMR